MREYCGTHFNQIPPVNAITGRQGVENLRKELYFMNSEVNILCRVAILISLAIAI